MRLIYVVGPPGSGKSTLMAALTEGCHRVPVQSGGMPRDLLYRGEDFVGCELGKRRASFSGTDALHMGIHPTAVKWIGVTTDPVVYAEGQRLATRKFLRAALDAGREVDLLWLDPPWELADARRKARGSRQDPTWVKAATTRANNLASAAEPMGVRVHRFTVPGSASEVAAQARAALTRPDEECA